MPDQPARSERTDQAYVEHKLKKDAMRSDIDHIAMQCNVLRQVQQPLAARLQFTAISLKDLNPHASAAISNTVLGIGSLCTAVLDRAANIRRAVDALPEPPLPVPSPSTVPDPALWYVVEHALTCSVLLALSDRGEACDPIDANSRPNNATPFTSGIASIASDAINARLSLPCGVNYFVDDKLPGDPFRSVREVTNRIVAMLRKGCAEGMALDEADTAAADNEPASEHGPVTDASKPRPATIEAESVDEGLRIKDTVASSTPDPRSLIPATQ